MSAIGEANRAHWNNRAQDYDAKPWLKKMIEDMSVQIVEHRDVFGLPRHEEEEGKSDFRLLDYACGPGTITKALLPHVSHIQGIDVSDSMVAEYNQRSAAAGTSSMASAVQGNLLGEEPYLTLVDPATQEKKETHEYASNPAFNDFDAVIVGFGFHHFENWAAALRTLSLRLKTGGGVVGIVDLYPDEEHWHDLPEDARKMMHKTGFTRDEMEGYMMEAGLEDFKMLAIDAPIVMEIKGKQITRKVFLASGRRK